MNCILTGVGGQGTILASKLIANAAMAKGLQARTAETIGMAQRGGSVVSHVRTGEKIYSPLIPANTADVIIGFEPSEAVRSLFYLKKEGIVIVSNVALKPVTSSLNETDYAAGSMLAYLKEKVDKVVIIDTDSICQKCGSTKVINVVLLGAAAASGKIGLIPDEIEGALCRLLPQKYLEMNIKALHEGIKAFFETEQ